MIEMKRNKGERNSKIRHTTIETKKSAMARKNTRRR